MFNILVSVSLRNRLLVLAMAAVLVLYGAYSAAKLPVDVFPDLNRPTVTIMTEAKVMRRRKSSSSSLFPLRRR